MMLVFAIIGSYLFIGVTCSALMLFALVRAKSAPTSIWRFLDSRRQIDTLTSVFLALGTTLLWPIALTFLIPMAAVGRMTRPKPEPPGLKLCDSCMKELPAKAALPERRY